MVAFCVGVHIVWYRKLLGGAFGACAYCMGRSPHCSLGIESIFLDAHSTYIYLGICSDGDSWCSDVWSGGTSCLWLHPEPVVITSWQYTFAIL